MYGVVNLKRWLQTAAAAVLAVGAIGVFGALLTVFAADGGVQVPVIMYHAVIDDSRRLGQYVVSPAELESDFAWLQRNGYTAVLSEDLIRYVEDGTPLPEKPVLITFDDGYRSAYELAFPILQEMDFHAAMFPIGVSVGKDTYKDTGLAMVPHFSWEEAKEMVESGLVSIQSHTYDMHQWEAFETAGGGQCLRPNILRQPWETLGEYMQALREDVERSRQDIVEGTGQEAVALAYPGGLHDQISEELLRSYGVKCTFTIEGGKAQVTPGSERSLYGLNRFYVKPTTTDEEFLQWVG